MEDRSALFNQLKNFSQRKLKKVETKVVTASGEQLVEKRGAKGLQVLTGGQDGANNAEAEPPRKLDLQVGMVLPGFLIGSQDVAHDKSSLDSYGVTHILNLDSDIENKFEDDYNYKNITIQDKPDFELDRVLEDCYDFIDDGRHYGNVLVHCAGTIGLSRSTAVCIAYLMNKEKQKFDEAFNNVKEARSFVKPNEGFQKQLKEYEVKLRGAQEVKDSGIDDPFALRKKQEIEQEKAMVAGAASVKNRMKMFGATLDTGNASRSKSVSPSPAKTQPVSSSNTTTTNPAPTSRWSANKDSPQDGNKSISKSMTPEPRKSWQSSSLKQTEQPATIKSGGPPPPPPPMPTSLHDNDNSIKPLNSSSRSAAAAALPPPPPPPPPAGDLIKDSVKAQSKSSSTSVAKPSYERRQSTESHNSDSSSISETSKQRMVFGRVPPPAMKIKGGLSIEKTDNQSDRVLGFNKSTPQSKLIINTGSYSSNPAAFSTPQPDRQENVLKFDQRSASPMVLFNNVPPRFNSRPQSPKIEQQQALLGGYPQHGSNDFGQIPKRTVSLGPKRSAPPPPPLRRPQVHENTFARRDSFHKMANELQSSLTELNKLIDEPSTPVVAISKPPMYSSYLSSQNGPPLKTYVQQFNSPSIVSPQDEDDEKEEPPLTDWQRDSMNWKPSASINDLRSRFELKPVDAPSRTVSTNTLSSKNNSRPPRSASPSFLKNSPWANEAEVNSAAPVFPASDYAIRRTISTSNRSSIRNPYRSHYGNF